MLGEADRSGVAADKSQRLLACVADDGTREAVSQALSQLGWSNAKIRTGGIDAVRHAVDVAAPPRLVIVDAAEAEDPLGGVADLVQLCGQATRFIVIGAVNDVTLYRQLMNLGVADYLVKPVAPELLAEAVATAARAETAAPGAVRAARIFGFIGARGGVGTSTVALSMAWLLQREFKLRAAVIDLDLHFGNAALSLDLEPGRGLREALENPERTDNLLLASAMVGQGEKVPILASEEPLEEMLQFDGAAVMPLLAALSQDYDCIIVDLPRSLDAMTRQVIALADATILVTDLSLSALRDTMRLTDLARALQARHKPLLVANQAGASHRGEIGRPDFERGIGGALDFVIPFDTKAALAVAHSGKPFPAAASGSKATAELRKLAARLAGREEKRGGLLARFKR